MAHACSPGQDAPNVRLSRPRVVLRIALLAAGGAFMLWRAVEARRAGPGPEPLGARMALVWALVGVLALLTAGAAALSLRRRPRRRTLTLGDPDRDPPARRGHASARDQ